MICLAEDRNSELRFLEHFNPSILILDEDTSALDAESECTIKVSMGVLSAAGDNSKRVVIIIEHRLLTEASYRIVVMNREFAKLLGGLHAKSSMAELSKIDRGDEVDVVKLSELFNGLYFRGSIIAMILMDKLGRKALLILAMSMGMQELLGVA
ncbi:major facilitator superfamily protein [Tanacetum coccineum]